MSLSQGYSVGKVLFLPALNDSGSDCTIVTLIRVIRPFVIFVMKKCPAVNTRAEAAAASDVERIDMVRWCEDECSWM